jgi:hypothetical protein
MANTNRNDEANGHRSSAPSTEANNSSRYIEGNDQPQAQFPGVADRTDIGRNLATSTTSAGRCDPTPALNGTVSTASLVQSQLDVRHLPNVHIDELRPLTGVLDRNDVRPDHAPASSPGSPTVHAKNEGTNKSTNEGTSEGTNEGTTSNDQDNWSFYTRPSSFTVFL